MQLKEAIQICLTYLGDEDAIINTRTAQHQKLKLFGQVRQSCDKRNCRRVRAADRRRDGPRSRQQDKF